MLERVELEEVLLEPASLQVEPSALDSLSPIGDIEEDSAAELKVVESEFAKKTKDETARFKKATDSEYWACICFQDREQADAFIRAVGGNPKEKYLDGQKVARRLGIEIPSSDVPFGRTKIDQDWSNLAMEE